MRYPRGILLIVVAFLAILIAGTTTYEGTQAYELHGFSITDGHARYFAPEEMLLYAQDAIQPWTDNSALTAEYVTEDPNVEFVFREPECITIGEYAGICSDKASTLVDQDPYYCTIVISPSWWPTASETSKRRVLTHEFGHCAGLNHSKEISIMRGLFWDFSPDDASGVRKIYPFPNRLIIPGMTRD